MSMTTFERKKSMKIAQNLHDAKKLCRSQAKTIKEQAEEIARLKDEACESNQEEMDLIRRVNGFKAEIERLKAENKRLILKEGHTVAGALQDPITPANEDRQGSRSKPLDIDWKETGLLPSAEINIPLEAQALVVEILSEDNRIVDVDYKLTQEDFLNAFHKVQEFRSEIKRLILKEGHTVAETVRHIRAPAIDPEADKLIDGIVKRIEANTTIHDKGSKTSG